MLALLVLASGILTPPALELGRAAARGDLAALSKLLESQPRESSELDSALVLAASFGHVACMSLLVEKNAGGMEEALMQAALRDSAHAVAWLISEDRAAPAANLREAAKVASASDSTMSEWLLVTALRRH